MSPLFLATALAFALPARAECPSRPTPTEDWPDGRAEAAAAKPAQIQALEDYAFKLEGEDKERKGVRTDGVVIIHKGRVVYERYGRGFDASKRHLSWSVSKSFTSALVGIAMERTALSLDDSICKHVKAKRQDNCAITVRNLMEFASGLDWREDYEDGGSYQTSSVLAMLYGQGRQDMVSFITAHERSDEPGTSWRYSSGDATLLSGVLDAALRPSVGKDWPWVLLLDKLGMKSATWERDGKGVVVGSSYLLATPRDLAKFGFLYLNDGCWAGERVLPENWVTWSTQVSEPIKRKSYERGTDDVQGWQWWLNRPIPGVQAELPWPSVPEGAFAARGHWGQSISIIPSKELIVVRTADDRDGSFSLDTFLKLALAVVEELP
ncbi:serine hydrolase domain-containing protein [Archangium lansingense]|uniref:Serine hydrolase n=1 Tax=Archangium lansingense TaxID=2995310 RepID=A0ABT4AQD4_9BACT|nr:serine hydrolase [Archangium lansinium]MCY1083049.1 serine hydrolase [Archangium lansinium]